MVRCTVTAAVAVAIVVGSAGVAPPVTARAGALVSTGSSGPLQLLDVESTAFDVSDRGVVVGWYVPGDDEVRHAFRRSARGRVTDLGPGVAYAVNDAGVVVGERTEPDGTSRATQWGRGGRARDLGLDENSVALDINDDGTIVGYVSHPDNTIDAFVVDPRQRPELLPHPPGIPGAEDLAIDLNDRGAIAGYSHNALTSHTRPVLWRGRDHTPILLPGRRDDYDVTGINNRGTVVGSTLEPGAGYQAVVWVGRDHDEVDVGETGVQSLGRDINDAGAVVGVRYNAGDAFLWDPRTGQTTILLAPTDIRDEATAINDHGAIVGYSTVPDSTIRATLFAR
jgi:uncharacterized membrane protein